MGSACLGTESYHLLHFQLSLKWVQGFAQPHSDRLSSNLDLWNPNLVVFFVLVLFFSIKEINIVVKSIGRRKRNLQVPTSGRAVLWWGTHSPRKIGGKART